MDFIRQLLFLVFGPHLSAVCDAYCFDLLLPLLALSACGRTQWFRERSLEPDRGIITDMGGMQNDASEDVDSTTATDAGTDATATDAGIEVDAAIEPDASPMRDMMMPVAIDSCESACARYDACGRTGDVFGSSEQCLANCERLTRGGEEGVQGWWNSNTRLHLLHLCTKLKRMRRDLRSVEGCEIGLVFPTVKRHVRQAVRYSDLRRGDLRCL